MYSPVNKNKHQTDATLKTKKGPNESSNEPISQETSEESKEESQIHLNLIITRREDTIPVYKEYDTNQFQIKTLIGQQRSDLIGVLETVIEDFDERQRYELTPYHILESNDYLFKFVLNFEDFSHIFLIFQ